MERFSVSMCVYGGDNPQWFTSAVESILHQTVPPSEVVLVVDGPVPEELDIVIRKYEENLLFHVIRLPENQGHGNARRTGLAACRYPLVAIMDADDISVPQRFEKQLSAFAANPRLDIVGGNIAEFVGTPENVVGKRIVPETDSAIKQYMKTRCPMNLVTVMFRKASVEQVGGFMDWYCEEDYYLWLRMAQAGMRFANVPDILVQVRVGEDMYRRRGGWKYFRSEARLQTYMLDHKIIGLATFSTNIVKRLIVQVLLPNRIRGWVFQTFARSRQT